MHADLGPVFPSEMSAGIVKTAEKPTPGAAVPLPKEKVPLARMGDEADMAGQILYLASKAGSYLNGSVNVVDGGRLGIWGGLI
jgi:NAD(P)-dependent dehydrogenase (short-subunit alcohol dehydrogenase family)